MSLLPAGKCVCATSVHFFSSSPPPSDDDERAVQVCQKMKEMSVFLPKFISLNSGVFYALGSCAVPASASLSVLGHRYAEPPLGCRSPISASRRSHLHPETSTNRITMTLRGLGRGEIETNRLDFTEVVIFCRPALTDYLAGKSHSWHSGI